MNRPQDLIQFSALVAFDNGHQITLTDEVFEFEQALTLVARCTGEYMSGAVNARPTICFLVLGTHAYHYAGESEILDQLGIDG